MGIAALAIAIPATAQAQEDPYVTVEEQAETSQLDTDLTPVAKETDLWTLLHGAKYPETEVIEDSATTFSTDLHAVAFQNRTIGLAAGSRCSLEPVQQRTESNEEFGARVADCRGTDETTVPRVPALYRYAELQNEDPRWEKLDLPGEERPGYIGAIAWIDAQRALIVGGTGAYPRREQAPDPAPSTDPDKDDQAGTARAWVYRRASATAPERVEEIDLSAHAETTTVDGQERAGMRGFTALDCYRDPNPQPGEAKIELCLAGALGQIWEWRNGSFNGGRIDALSEPAELTDARLFSYRVRDVAFASQEPPQALAATAGCCDIDPAKSTPRILRYSETASPRWAAQDYVSRASVPEVPACTPKPIALTPSVCLPPEQHAEANRQANEADHTIREQNTTPTWPDSIYSIFPSGSGAAAILSPGDPDPAGDRPSVIASHTNSWPVKPETELLRAASFSTARLLDGDGTFENIDPNRPGTHCPAGCTAGGEPDWAVGELRSSARGKLGAHGLVVATGLAPTAQESVNADASSGPFGIGINCGDSCFSPGVRRPTPTEIAEGWEPVDQEKLDHHVRSQHYLLPSYTANAIDMSSDGGDGWMVGDHGAILGLSKNALQAAEGASEPKPPRLGAPRPKSLSDRDAYEDSRAPLPETAGIVPALGAETESLPEPKMVGMGYTGALDQVVMSRDGSEGWAIGTLPNGGPRFSRFDGQSWSECDPLGVEGISPPDPACEAMAPLLGWRNSQGGVSKTKLTHMTRVPLENDSDPTNDNELEIVAISSTVSDYRGPETGGEPKAALVHYSDGRWRFASEELAAGLPSVADTQDSSSSDFLTNGYRGIAFTGPDDGWLVATVGTVYETRLYHFDGRRWANCDTHAAECGRPRPRLTLAEGFSAQGDLRGLAVAGERVYIYGQRRVPPVNGASGVPVIGGDLSRGIPPAPLILYRDPGGDWTDGSAPGEDGGGLDPNFGKKATEEEGVVGSLAVVQGPDGPEGWALGKFGEKTVALPSGGARTNLEGSKTSLLRFDPGGEGWRELPGTGGPAPSPGVGTWQDTRAQANLQVTYPSAVDPEGTFFGVQVRSGPFSTANGRLYGFNSERGRFDALDSARPLDLNETRDREHATSSFGASSSERISRRPVGVLHAMAPDGQGGFWASISGHFFRYTDNPPKDVFTETANPLGNSGAAIRAIEGGPDGSVWLATDSDRLYRYDRIGGWEETRVGWDPGRVVTRTSQANEIAIGPGGEGLVVGEEGRIANLSPSAVVLDPASGRSCALKDAIPCGTSRDLHAVDIAPDGSAIAGGDRLSLLWRPRGSEFRAIETPPIAGSTQITAVSYPTPTRAYLATERGVLFRGELTGADDWTWEPENTTADGSSLSLDSANQPIPLRDIAVDAAGRGYAVGDAGHVLERSADGSWRRLPVRYPTDLTAVALPEAGGEGVLIGGKDGLILTGAGAGAELRLARAADFREGSAQTGAVGGFAYLPGTEEGSVDAWAAIEEAPTGAGGDQRLLRHRSNPTDPLLEPAANTPALPDAPDHADGELSLGAFGKSDCDRPVERYCSDLLATTTTNDAISEAIVDELAGLREAGKLDLAVATGDLADTGDYHADTAEGQLFNAAPKLKHVAYAELVADELDEKGVPLFAAIGGQDLSTAGPCFTIVTEPLKESGCRAAESSKAGENLAWRQAFAGRAAPWGSGDDVLTDPAEGELQLTPVSEGEENALRTEDQQLHGEDDVPAPPFEAKTGGAATHYALDATREGEAIARIVFVDTSMGSLAASDPLQQPHELAGGQLRFLERMICREGEQTSFGDPCSREADQRAIVVSNTPTYSYGPGALANTATDATTFEALMLKYDVDLVISGALGYNGLYYTLAPGIHEPCPAGEYPSSPPSGNTPDCLAGPTGPAEAATDRAPAKAPDPASLIAGEGLSGAYPTLIASGAGGKFGPEGSDDPPDGPAGQWHGYSLARLLPDGEIAVEQRPILDWIGIDAANHTLAPRTRLVLNGYGRSPVSSSSVGQQPRAFHYEISTPAITHRYDLSLADPDEPWLPCDESDIGCQELHANLAKSSPEAEATPAATGEDNPCSPYLCLPSRIGVVDGQSGRVRAGDGRYPETFAVAMLSVDEEVATYPLVFKRSPSFVTSPAIRSGILPKTSDARTSPPPPPPPPPGLPQIPQVEIPQIPPPPGIPQLTAATPPELQPPAPPAPPPPSQQPAPLDLSVAPPGVSISTPTALIQPPTPPVNPAPPGGARREARQRQAAAQKGGADSSDEQPEAMEGGGDMAEGRPGSSAMTRLEATARARESARGSTSFTALAQQEQASAWSRGALYGGGLAFAALVLACSWMTLRPTPRRRGPEVPAPARSTARSYRR